MAHFIWVTFRVEGLHHAPMPLPEMYLQHPHRHLFHFRVEIEVFHGDREIEFIAFKRWCHSQISSTTAPVDFGTQSCEHIAEALCTTLKHAYPQRRGYVEVSEDGENGCRVPF